MRLVKTDSQKGQSLVEMAIMTPLLIFFILGIFEVGVAIRGYLVLVNANREITRFAVRPGYLNFSTQADTLSSFQDVRGWVDSSVSTQLNLDFSEANGNTTMIISHIVVDTGLPCGDIYSNPGNCNCDAFTTTPGYTNTFTIDDLIIHPGIQGMEYQTKRFGPASTTTGSRATHINYSELVAKLIPQNNKFNCEIIKRGGVPSANNLVITELFHDQPQLFGFPLISNPFTDPVPLYTHTTMRLAAGARSNGSESGGLIDNVDKTGPVCDAFPFAVQNTTIEYGTENKVGDVVDILDGPDISNHHGWLAWNPAKTAENDIRNELLYSTISLNDFIDATQPSDDTLSVYDYVTSSTGSHAPLQSEIEALVGSQIRIPVWQSFSLGNYYIIGFAWVRIQNTTDINLGTNTVEAVYLGDAAADCPIGDVANTPPDAVDDGVSTLENTELIISILDNDSGDAIGIDTFTQPDNGTVVDNGNGTLKYTPDSGFSGYDTFTYTISDDNGGTDTATVVVTVGNVPTPTPTNTPTPTDTPTITPTPTETPIPADTATPTITPTPSPTPTDTPTPTYTRLQVRHSSKCMDINGASSADGADAIQWDCQTNSNQKWTFEDMGGGYYRLRVQHSNKCLNVSGSNNGANVNQASCGNGYNQQWQKESMGGGYFRLKARHSDMCLDVNGASTSNGASLIQWSCHTGQNQQWREY